MNELWNKVLAELELEVSKTTYITFFKGTRLESLDDSVARISTASFMNAEFIEKRYYSMIKQILDKHTGQNISIVFTTSSRKIETKTDAGPLFVDQMRNEPVKRPLPGIRADYTFETLAVSESNQLGYTAAATVAKNPGIQYNPLFFYGTVGVGKTHLMHAVANALYQNNPTLSVAYLSTEEFTNEVVEAIQGKTTIQLRKRFRNVDLLLLDDVQFLSGKNTIQEELFHTFNALVDKQKQIVFSSDRPPQELKKVEARLISRFEGGLTVDIQAPDFELRTAILLIKSKKFGLNIDLETAKMAAELILDTRALEGFLLKVSSVAMTQNTTTITQDIVLKALGSVKKQAQSQIHSEDIINAICEYYGIKPKQLKGSKRDAFLVKARHMCMYFLKEDLKLPLVEIGYLLGGRDHTTIMHGVEKVRGLLDNSEKTREDMMFIKRKIQEDILS